ncbi:hypothetical protein [Leptolyngbya sp. GGD]|uniref:hypothetical protein n=1 Tax=Leptolyngbya sp. GGD TaxID=2997907 RepID=UPI00227A2E18|nr:hypothetical protein [Leptolyngbya sp. GGD]MCY6493910.1 hypothetical protein [Leptolyngbya sp. GGD]
MSAIQAIPEQEQLVKVQQRLYVMTNGCQTTLPAGLLLSKVTSAQYLVLLSSIKDNGLDEELQVIWGLEPGAQSLSEWLPKPIGFDDSADWMRFSTRCGRAAADIRTLQAPFRSGTDLEDY